MMMMTHTHTHIHTETVVCLSHCKAGANLRSQEKMNFVSEYTAAPIN